MLPIRKQSRVEPGGEIGRPEKKMLIKTIKEIQEENRSKADADKGKTKADTDTWSWVGRNNQKGRIVKDVNMLVEGQEITVN